jgi:hypothetical protein
VASKSRYVKVSVTSDARSLAGYKVLGDVMEGSQRVLVLERPEITAPPRKRKVTPKVTPAPDGVA